MQEKKETKKKKLVQHLFVSQKQKVSLQILVCFFLLIFGFTVISRAADSIKVAKVTICYASSGKLMYQINGQGEVKENGTKYIAVHSQYIIKEVKAESNTKVIKGAPIFTYELEPLKEEKERLEKELEKLELDYQKLLISDNSQAANNASELESARRSVEYAKEDLKEAQKNVKEQEEKQKEGNQKQKEEKLKTKEEELEGKEEALEEMGYQKNQEMQQAEQTIADAKEELEKQQEKMEEPKKKIDDVLIQFRSAVMSHGYQETEQDNEIILKFYYGDDYEAHQKQVKNAEKVLERAKEDRDATNEKWKYAINFSWDQRQAELDNAERTVQDATEALLELTKVDDEIKAVMNEYRKALSEKSAELENILYQKLFQMLEKEKTDKNTDTSAVSVATKALQRAEEKKQSLESEWNRKEQKAREEIEELKEEMKELKKEEEEIDLESAKDIVKQRERDLENAEFNLKQIEEKERRNQTEQREQENKTEQLAAIEKKKQQLDIKDKKEEIAELIKLIESGGEILASADGVIFHSLKEGMILTGTEEVKLISDNYQMEVTIDDEETIKTFQNFKKGDEIVLNNNKESKIEHIEHIEWGSQITFTVLLSNQDYQIGEIVSYELRKSSDLFQQCLPIGALREGANKIYYVLILKEEEGILGKEQVAFQIPVEIIDKDTQMVAFQSSGLSMNDQVILGSSKNISEGDRVRIDD